MTSPSEGVTSAGVCAAEARDVVDHQDTDPRIELEHLPLTLVPVVVAHDGAALQLPLDDARALAAAEREGVNLEAKAREAQACGEQPVASGMGRAV
ncbi:hypothetical protein [Sinomonas sp. B1-1]|uniref:hypothetical protein n=1 Tax=Sinomonas sp. B1-1 TaxID=3141454 RepID=UPI003D29FE1D